MGKGFAQAGYGLMLNSEGLLPEIKVVIGLIITTFYCFFRVGTFPDLGLDLLEGFFQSITTPPHGGVAGGGCLGKSGREIQRG